MKTPLNNSDFLPTEADVSALTMSIGMSLDNEDVHPCPAELTRLYQDARTAIEGSDARDPNCDKNRREAAFALLKLTARVEEMKEFGKESLVPDHILFSYGADIVCDAIRDLEDLDGDDVSELIDKLQHLCRAGNVWLDEDGRGVNEALADRLRAVLKTAIRVANRVVFHGGRSS